MTAPLLYLLKANAVLVLFALVYYALLRRLTFFGLNRAYLLLALSFAAVYPALPVPQLFAPDAPLPALVANWVPRVVAAPAGPDYAEAGIDWPRAALLLYLAGAAVVLARLLLQLRAVWQLHRRSRPAEFQGQPFRELADVAGPFSFGPCIYLNPGQHPAPELAAVLRHEQVHVRQFHTLDVLLSQLVLAAAWCNPAAWLLRRAVLDNLEYLADHHALQSGLDRRAYQYSLLRLSHGSAGPTLVSHFTFLTLKNRIAMMNTPASASAQTVRYLLAVPLVLGLALGFTAAQAHSPAASSQTAASGPGTYYVDGKLSDKAAADKINPKTIVNVQVFKDDVARQLFGKGTQGAIVITTAANQNSAEVKALNEKIARVAPATPATK